MKLLLVIYVAENADISKLFAVAVSGKGQQKGPFEAHDAPHRRQVEALRVTQGCGGGTDTDQNSVLYRSQCIYHIHACPWQHKDA